MEKSILKSLKTALNYDLDDAFDEEIMMDINTIFATLTDLGVGPSQGFIVEDDSAEWKDFFIDESDLTLHRIKTYIRLRVRLIFDPPGTSHHINAMQEQIKELEYRISVHREDTQWSTPLSLPSLP